MSNHNIEQQVLNKIHSGEVAMHSRRYFALRVASLVVLSLIVLLLTVFVLSFVFFSIHESGERFLIGFGSQGIVTLLQLFPWMTLVLDALLIVLLEQLVRTFRFGYTIPVMRVFLALIALAVAASVLLNFTPLHTLLLDRADHDALPILGPAYEHIHDSHRERGVFRGNVVAVATSTFTMSHYDADRDTDDGSWVVEPPNEFDLKSLVVGDHVYVAGDPHNGTIRAYGVEKFQ